MAQMKKILFSVLIMLVLLGCSAQLPEQEQQPVIKVEQPTCKTPYIEFKVGECCLDTNNNAVCDTDETTEEQAEPEETLTENTTTNLTAITQTNDDSNLIKQMLETAPKGYVFRIAKGSVVYPITVLNEKRSIGEYLDYADNAYWDTTSPNLLLYAGEIPEQWWCRKKNIPCEETKIGSGKYYPAFFNLELTRDKNKDRNLIPDDLKRWYWWAPFSSAVAVSSGEPDKTLWVSFFYDKSPVEWMQEYANEEPIKVSRTKLQINSVLKQVTVDLSISFKDKKDPEKTIVFLFDPKYKIPIRVDEIKNGMTIQQHIYDINTVYRKDAQTNWEITPKLTEPPANHITISFDERRDYDEYLEGSVECVGNIDCTASEICYNRQCVTAECKSNYNCTASQPFCDMSNPTNYQCVECLKDTDCPTSKHCTDKRCLAN